MFKRHICGETNTRQITAVLVSHTCEAGMMLETAENRVLEWGATVAVYQNSRKKRILHANTLLFSCFLGQGMLNIPKDC